MTTQYSTVNALPYPQSSDTNNVPTHLADLITALDSGSFIRRMSQSTRNALTTAQKPAGRVIFNTTSSKAQIYDGADWWDLVHNLTLSTEISFGWSTYTPTLIQSGAVAKTVSYASYTRIGARTILASFELAVTGAGTSGQPIYVGLPVDCIAGTTAVGSAVIFDASGSTHYEGMLQVAPAASSAGLITTGYGTFAGQSPAFALASGDNVRGTLMFQSAT